MTGIVIRVLGRFYTVRHEGGEIDSVLRGRMKTDVLMKKFSNPVAVGDNVNFHINEEGLGVIESVIERKNHFSRKDKIKGKEDLIAANLDQIVAVQAFTNPRLNLRFVDRILVRGVSVNVPVVLCVNKLDLATDKDLDYIKSYYTDSGLEIIFTSAKGRVGIDDFHRVLKGRRSLFIGYSGVGKTSLLNCIYPGLNLKTSEVSDSTGKGRHTTTNVRMVNPTGDTDLIDTPGVREFGLMDVEPHMLGSYFKDFLEPSQHCRFSPCTHDHEPDCEVIRLVEEGVIHKDRYISYLNILYSLKENLENMY